MSAMEPKPISELLKDPFASYKTMTSVRSICLSPRYIGNIAQGIRDQLNSEINLFSRELDSVVVSYDNIKLLQSVANIIDDLPYLHFRIQAEYIVFKPTVGCLLKGVVNKVSKDHVGCLIHNRFNASIHRPRQHLNGWRGSRLQQGEEFPFEVLDIYSNNAVISLKGKLVDQKMIEAYLKSLKNTDKTSSSLRSGEPVEIDSEGGITLENEPISLKHKRKASESHDKVDAVLMEEDHQESVSKKKKKKKRNKSVESGEESTSHSGNRKSDLNSQSGLLDAPGSQHQASSGEGNVEPPKKKHKKRAAEKTSSLCESSENDDVVGKERKHKKSSEKNEILSSKQSRKRKYVNSELESGSSQLVDNSYETESNRKKSRKGISTEVSIVMESQEVDNVETPNDDTEGKKRRKKKKKDKRKESVGDGEQLQIDTLSEMETSKSGSMDGNETLLASVSDRLDEDVAEVQSSKSGKKKKDKHKQKGLVEVVEALEDQVTKTASNLMMLPPSSGKKMKQKKKKNRGVVS